MNISRFLIVFGLVVIGVISRLLPHPPNFTAINAVTLMSACYFGNRFISSIVVLATLLLSDLAIGFHSSVPCVYFSLGLMIFIGYYVKDKMTTQTAPLFCVANSLLFFLITNFGVWLSGTMYADTASGLLACYAAAIPFLINQIAGDLTYGLVLFGYAYSVDKRLAFR